MILWLAVRDPVWLTWRMLFPIALFLGFVLRFLTRGIPGGVWLGAPLAIVMWNLLLLQQKEGLSGVRALPGTAHLPFAARSLWLARMLAMTLAAGLLPLVVAAVAYSTAQWPTKPDLLFAALLLAACEVFAITVAQARAPALLEAGPPGKAMASNAVGHLLGLCLLFGLSGRGAGWIAAPALLAACTAFFTWRRIPPVFLAAPDKSPREKETGLFQVPALPLALQTGRLVTGWHVVFVALLVLVCAMLPGEYWPLPMAVMLISFIAPLGLMMVQTRTHLVSYLPLRRRVVFAWALLPPLFVAIGGLFLNRLVWGARPFPDDLPIAVLGLGSVAIWTGMLAMALVKMQPPAMTTAGRRRQMALQFVASGLMIGFWVVLYIVSEAPGAIGQIGWAAALRNMAIRWVESVPDAPVLGFLVTLAALGVSYRMLERWFERVDVSFDLRST